MKIYLASKSPRRKELLTQMGVEFEILSLDIPEEVGATESPVEYSQRITTEKLTAAWDKVVTDKIAEYPVLCADTEVVLDGRILGKPNNYNNAFDMLKSYSNHSHQVITTVGVKYHSYEKIATNTTVVSFAPMSDEVIHRYLATGDYKDKSGSYGIQSYIGQFIKSIDGCFYSVMGLPLNTTRELLESIPNYI